MVVSGSLVAWLDLEGCCVYDVPKMESKSERPGEHHKAGKVGCGGHYNEESYLEIMTLDKLAEFRYEKAGGIGDNVAGFATARGISGFAHGRRNCVNSLRYTVNGPRVRKKRGGVNRDGRFRLVIEMR